MPKRWTQEEIDYLESSWGRTAVSTISKKLNRSECAVKLKAGKLGLGAFLDSGEYVTLNQLLSAIGKTGSNTYLRESWVRKRGLPIKKKRVNKCSFVVIYINDFWEWAYKHRSRIDFSKIPKNILPPEPAWVDDARKNNSTINRKIIKSPWTAADDNLLKDLLKMHRYTADELSARLNRTESAVIRRISTLGLKERPVRNSQHTPWTEQETELLFTLLDQGYDYEYIKVLIPRHSVKAIRGLVYRECGTEDLDKVRILRKENDNET